MLLDYFMLLDLIVNYSCCYLNWLIEKKLVQLVPPVPPANASPAVQIIYAEWA